MTKNIWHIFTTIYDYGNTVFTDVLYILVFKTSTLLYFSTDIEGQLNEFLTLI